MLNRIKQWLVKVSRRNNIFHLSLVLAKEAAELA